MSTITPYPREKNVVNILAEKEIKILEKQGVEIGSKLRLLECISQEKLEESMSKVKFEDGGKKDHYLKKILNPAIEKLAKKHIPIIFQEEFHNSGEELIKLRDLKVIEDEENKKLQIEELLKELFEEDKENSELLPKSQKSVNVDTIKVCRRLVKTRPQKETTQKTKWMCDCLIS